ncbi:FUSC family protein [Mycobacterium sp. NPDC003323]
MTEPDNTSTRPISVAELLAKNGSIGAPAPGGRRRRRRGNADAVTVAELTGEIPIVTIDEAAEAPTAETPPVEEPVEETPAEAAIVEETLAETPSADEPEADEPEADEPEAEEAEAEEPEADARDAQADTEATDTEATDTEAATSDYEAHLQQREADPEPVAFQPRRRAHGFSRRSAEESPFNGGIAEEMSPDPLLDDSTDADADRPSYLKSPADTLFGGDSVADEATRRTKTPSPEDIDLDGTADTEVHRFDVDDEPAGSPLMRGFWIVAQSVLAVALGAGLFIAFDQLWKWNNIVALALSVLVILGLVVGVRVVRKTEDIASTLIAVAVGAMVTLGPLALLQST